MSERMYWYRCYNGMSTDPKLRRIARETGLAYAYALAVWAHLLDLASASPDRGRLLLTAGVPVTAADIAANIYTPEEIVNPILQAMTGLNMLHLEDDAFVVSHFQERQEAIADVTRRVREHRARKQAASAPAEPCHAPVTETYRNTESESESEIEKELKESPPVPEALPVISLESPEAAPVGAAPAPSKIITTPDLQSARNQVRKELERAFCEITHIPPPKTQTESQRRAAGRLWWSPLREIADLSGWDSEAGRRLIAAAVAELKGLTVSDPNSLLKTARSVAARRSAPRPASAWAGFEVFR